MLSDVLGPVAFAVRLADVMNDGFLIVIDHVKHTVLALQSFCIPVEKMEYLISMSLVLMNSVRQQFHRSAEKMGVG